MSKVFFKLCVFLFIIIIFTGCASDENGVPAVDSPGVSQDTAGSGGNGGSGESGLTDPDDNESQSGSPDDSEAGSQDGVGQPGDSVFPDDNGFPVVYFSAEISPESLVAIYNALGVEPFGNIAIKIHTGEPPNSNYLRPELIGDLVRLIGGTLVETNTAGGRRASTAMHMQVVKDHGFYDLAPFDLLDAEGEVSIPISGGLILDEVLVGVNVPNYDFYVVLSHFKGHASAGYGGALKNLSIGLASAPGKSLIHSGGERRTGYRGDQDRFLKGMAEASSGIIDYFNGNFLYINVMNRLSVDCDCMGNPAKPDMHDIGILASLDPVALDQACVDLVYSAPDGASLIRRIESRNGIHTLEHAAALGIGSREYILVNIDG